MSRRATDHPARVRTDRQDLARTLINRHHRRLKRHHATAALVDDGIRCAQIDGKLPLGPQPQAGS
jgi:hypothetical protein